MAMTFNDDLDINLESTVLSALSRLQKRSRINKKQNDATIGVSWKKIVEFLKANCTWLDGDVESQVMTALLSCVKAGIVCALDNRKFLLLRANAQKMISNCVTRVSHGPKCCCLPMLRNFLKAFSGTCCYLKKPDPCDKKLKKCPNARTRGPSGRRPEKAKTQSSPRRKKTSKRKPAKRLQKNCASWAQSLIGTSKSALSVSDKLNEKCNYCSEFHPLPKLRKLCLKCYPIGKFNTVPPDKFSPRDELLVTLEGPVKAVAKNVENVVKNTEK